MRKIITILVLLFLCSGCTAQTKEDTASSVLVVEDGMIKYENNGEVQDVIALKDLLNGIDNTSYIDAREIELFVENGYIVWNYIGETSVHKLIAIDDLVGEQGATGLKGDTGATGPQGAAGADGSSAYIWVKYLDNDPLQSTDADLKDEASNYMGIYYGTLASAPSDIASYQWYEIKGEKGDTGATGAQGPQGIQGVQGIQGEQGATGNDGTNAYVWIRYAETDPLNTSVTISETPNNYIGIYSGDSDTAPTNASDYNWFKIKGEQGEKGDTGETGATGPQGPQGDAGVTIESYYDNLAIVTCPYYIVKGEHQIQQKSCSLDYKGQNVDVEVKDDQSQIYLATLGEGTYLFEVEADFSYETEETADSCLAEITFGFTDYQEFQTESKKVDTKAKEAKIYIIRKKTIPNSEVNLQWSTGFDGIIAANGIWTLKIHKVE